MIDSHAHLEQPQFSKDLDQVIKRCKKEGLKAIISSCAHPNDFKKTMQIIEKYKGFVFASIGIHPEYIKNISGEQINELIEKIKQNKDKIVGIGEVGLDYNWVKENEWREKQRILFIKMIKLAKEIDKPLIIHSRDALKETLEILEKENPTKVLLHMWGGYNVMDKVNSLGYYISMNSIVMRSKSYRKVVKKTPVDKLMLETDAPWLAVKKADKGYEIDIKSRNDPTTIKLTAEKIAELKGTPFEDIWKKCAMNSIGFFKLPLNI